MENHYREVVESKGGKLEYHTGNLKNGIRELEGRFKRADIVLCPVDCNSHAACTLVKKLGKKQKTGADAFRIEPERHIPGPFTRGDGIPGPQLLNPFGRVEVY